MNLINTDLERGAWMLSQASRIALIGNGGNLAIAQHMASDINRHMDKYCFAPDSIHLTAIAGDSDWKQSWLEYAAPHCDLFIVITCRTNSPQVEYVKEYAPFMPVLVLAPERVEDNNIDTIVIDVDTYHEFEVNALWTIYRLMEYNGVVLPKLPNARSSTRR